MRRLSTKTLAALLAAGLHSGSLFAATITGTVTCDGKVPNLPPLNMAARANCAQTHGGQPQPPDLLVLGSGNTMGNIMVSVASGLPAGKTYPTPPTPVVMDQKGCHYDPHVFGLMVNQPFKVLNSD